MRISRKLAHQYREGIRNGKTMVAKNRAGLPVFAIDFPPHGTPQHRASLHVVNGEIDRLLRRATRAYAVLSGTTSMDRDTK